MDTFEREAGILQAQALPAEHVKGSHCWLGERCLGDGCNNILQAIQRDWNCSLHLHAASQTEHEPVCLSASLHLLLRGSRVPCEKCKLLSGPWDQILMPTRMSD